MTQACLPRGLPADMLLALALSDGCISTNRKGIPGGGPCLSKGWEAEGPYMVEEWVSP